MFCWQGFSTFLLRISGVLLFLFLWECAPRLEWIDPYFVPPFSSVVAEIGSLFSSGYLSVHLLVSVWRAAFGLSLALMIGLPVGVLLGRRYPEAADAFDPVLRVLSQVNPFTLLPLFVLCFGIGEPAKIAVVAWVSLWPVIFYTVTASRQVDPVLLKTAASLGIAPHEMLFKVLLPGALPTVFVGIRIAAAITFYILISAEMLGASAGLGWLVHNSAMNYQIVRIYAGATFIVVLGFLLNRFLLLLERTLFDWQRGPALPGLRADTTGWRPGRATLALFAALFLIFIVAGGLEVREINREAAGNGPEGSHARHFGTPVDNSGF